MDFVVFPLFSSFLILNGFQGRTFLYFLYVGNFGLQVSLHYDDHRIDSLWNNQWAGLPWTSRIWMIRKENRKRRGDAD